jgi:hypothetical protein
MKHILVLIMMVLSVFASIGKITALNGEAYAIRRNFQVLLSAGSDVEKGDLIKTMPNTKLQIVFNDHTVISLGQKTEFKIDDYIFSKTKVKANFSVSRGIFKSITGKIGKIDHSKFKLRTKNATIGVRGTTFIGIIEDDKETIACTFGEIVVENDFGIVSVKKGEMTSFGSLEPPSPPKILKNNFIQKVSSLQTGINSNSNSNSNNMVVKSISYINNTSLFSKKVSTKVNSTINRVKDFMEKESFVGVGNKKEHKNSFIQDSLSHSISQGKNFTENENFVGIGNKKEYKNSFVQDSFNHSINQGKNFGKNLFSAIGNRIGNHKNPFYDNSNYVLQQNVDFDNEQFIGGDFENSDMEYESSQENMDDVRDKVSDLERLREKVCGVDKLHYSGMVRGDNIMPENNHINLDFDLGKGKVNGDIQFTTEKHIGFISTKSDWNTDVAGSFESGGKFNLQAISDGYSGNGNVELIGEHLEQARGSMSLKKKGVIVDEKADIDFTAKKTTN